MHEGQQRANVSVRSRTLVALSSLLVSLTAAEVALRYLAPASDPFVRFKSEDRASSYVPSAHAPNYQMEVTAEPGLPGVSGVSVFATNNMGFRGEALERPKPAGEYRVFLVGGSTLETMVLGESDTVHHQIQRRLGGWPAAGRQVKVYNTAKAGDKSYDHVAMIVHRLAHLKPDLLVVMAGVNDLRAAVLGADYVQLAESRATKYTLATLLKFAATEFQIPRRLHAALHRLGVSERARLEQITLVTDYRQKAALRKGRATSSRAPRTDLEPYAVNLRTIAGVARSQGVALMWATHPSTWNSAIDPRAVDWHWMTYLEGENYREDLMDQALDAYNDAMRRVARETSTCLVDLARSMPKSLEYFYDDVHFNAGGAALAGRLLEEGIRACAPHADF